MAYTQADLDTLEKMLISPTKEVTIGDQRVVYKDQKQILDLIKIVRESLAGAPSSSPNVIIPTFSKGQR